MNKSIRKSLYLCAAALMIGGVAVPTVSNSISASAHSRSAISRYDHKENVRKGDIKRLHHLQNIHKYHLNMETKDKRNLANHKKSLAHYNHLIRVHKHNHKMINNLTRAKRKLIKMINNDQHGITRQASLVESEEHQINLIKHAKPSKKIITINMGGKGYDYWYKLGRKHNTLLWYPEISKAEEHAFDAGFNGTHHNINYSGRGYNYWYNLGKHSHSAKGSKKMNHWENRAFIAGYNATHHPKSAANYAKMNHSELASAWSEIGYDVGRGPTYPNNYAQDEAAKAYDLSLVNIDSMSLANKLTPQDYDAKAFAKGLNNGRNRLVESLGTSEDNNAPTSIASSAYPSSAVPSAVPSLVMSAAAPSASGNY